MLQILLIVLETIRILATAVIIVVFLVAGALGVLLMVAEIERYIRRLRHKLAMRKMRKKIEKLFRESRSQFMMPYVEADIILTNQMYEFKYSTQQDNETINRATEYHHGISE